MTEAPDYPPGLYDLLAWHGLLRPGMRALDLGTGDGALARGLAAQGASVLGLDPDPRALDRARILSPGGNPAFACGLAERTDQPEAAFDLVTAGRAWHWFTRDLAAAEVRRVLKPGGALVLCHYDWVAPPGSVAHATEHLLAALIPSLRLSPGSGFYPAWAEALAGAGLVDCGFGGFDVVRHWDRAAWCAHVAAVAGVGRCKREGVTATLAALLAERFPEGKLPVTWRLFVLWARRA
ncbi:class I SAM-dependent methyltransferase [Falsiroseomonas selenitidurans]|uniref:Class I SAM-dependent methyltransferase n=1 Tax=Falsiroseomonas selenitidurans TaxID=2716335 RepID=A0ABX1E5P6_9PROT|nr:class I SAM-dependent methyltransferase [Falsiroseomonas selenitidurans]NKC32524.1 class I SAM-dependent methyltransferase [Falsiroseomonas selenitidurans]